MLKWKGIEMKTSVYTSQLNLKAKTMKMIKRIIVLMFVSLVFSGCGSSGLKYPDTYYLVEVNHVEQYSRVLCEYVYFHKAEEDRKELEKQSGFDVDYYVVLKPWDSYEDVEV